MIDKWNNIPSFLLKKKKKISTKLDQELTSLKSQQVQAQEVTEEEPASSSKKKPKQTKNAKPTEEMTTLLRKKRETLKEVTLKQDMTLQQLVSQLSHDQKDVAEELSLFGLKMPWTKAKK